MAVGEMIKKVSIDMLVFSLSGMICITGSYVIIKRFLAPTLFPAPASEALKAPDPKADHKEAEAKPNEKGHGEEKPNPEKGDVPSEDGINFPLKPVIVNLSGDTTRRFAKTTFTLQLKDEKAKSVLEKKDPQIYDALIKILSHYRYEQINSSEGKEVLKEEVKSRLNFILKDEPVLAVFIIELIVQ